MPHALSRNDNQPYVYVLYRYKIWIFLPFSAMIFLLFFPQCFYIITTFMVEINAASNFLLYCFFGKKFRTTLVILLRPRQKKFFRLQRHRSTIRSDLNSGSLLRVGDKKGKMIGSHDSIHCKIKLKTVRPESGIVCEEYSHVSSLWYLNTSNRIIN